MGEFLQNNTFGPVINGLAMAMVSGEFKEPEEHREKEALELVQKKHLLIKWEGREFCKDWEDRERHDIGVTLETSCPLNRARLP